MMINKKKYDLMLDERMKDLWGIATYIHANPELCFEEYKACKVQCEFLRKEGFQVQCPVGELETAYVASFGSGYPHIAVIAEYDALPQLGHGCGHNLICTTALGSALEVKYFLQEQKCEGTLFVIGTPAEESGGGKIHLLKEGVFKISMQYS